MCTGYKIGIEQNQQWILYCMTMTESLFRVCVLLFCFVCRSKSESKVITMWDMNRPVSVVSHIIIRWVNITYRKLFFYYYFLKIFYDQYSKSSAISAIFYDNDINQ